MKMVIIIIIIIISAFNFRGYRAVMIPYSSYIEAQMHWYIKAIST